MSGLRGFLNSEYLTGFELPRGDRHLHFVRGCGRVWGVEIHLECDTGASAGAVAERVSAVAGRDIFGEAGGKPEGAGHLRVHVGVEVGAAGFSVLDRQGAERSSAASMIPVWPIWLGFELRSVLQLCARDTREGS